MVTKPQDLLVILKLVSLGSKKLSFAALAKALSMSPSEVHAGVSRAQRAGLYATATQQPIRANLAEFLIHGVKYAFPCDFGGRIRGMPTSFAASPLREHMTADDSLPPVWPVPDGTVLGLSFSPLYKSVPTAAERDPYLYELLTLVDALRTGRVREQRLAASLLHERLGLEVSTI